VSDKKKILIIQPIHKAGIELLDSFSDYEYEIVEDTNIENLKSIISDCDGLSIRTAKLPSEVIELGKKLKVISRHGVGYDNIDLKSSKKNNITLIPRFFLTSSSGSAAHFKKVTTSSVSCLALLSAPSS